jgi:hypothetical protein
MHQPQVLEVNPLVLQALEPLVEVCFALTHISSLPVIPLVLATTQVV